MLITPYQAKYFAYDLTRRSTQGLDRLSTALFDAQVDLAPHQIEAALFALQSPLSKGVLLADEVGLGKTIEAGIVLCQYWAEHKRRLLILTPASLRKQWEAELREKFNLPAQVLDSKTLREAKKQGRNPFAEKAVLVMSYHFANAMRDELRGMAWDLVVIDEAHKLRNAYRPNNKVGRGIRMATDGCRKLLLTATPLQNSLLELYGLSILIDEHLFGDVDSFRSMYTGPDANLDALRGRLASFTKRTLRKEVTEYIRYTERKPLTIPFKPNDDEHAFYEAVSGFLQREDSYSLPKRQRHLTALILRKLLASSSEAIASTLDLMRQRLEAMRDERRTADEAPFPVQLIESDDFDDELLDDLLEEEPPSDGEAAPAFDRKKLQEEIALLSDLAGWARRLGVATKTRALVTALEKGFAQATQLGAPRKALIFTESRRTQEVLKVYLEDSGYSGKVVTFNGTDGGSEASAIYEAWAAKNEGTGRVSGSRAIDVRAALIDHFRDGADIMLATEAAAEGVNLQFCSLVINYDLPWNPQRIEQRIGRCHRYGQTHDVVVVNFLNERNEADRRVLELLSQKFNLFNGIFGASDEVLGTIESGVDFEKRILAIYQECRTSEAIAAAFSQLQAELDAQIRARLDDTRRKLIEHFDEEVHERLRVQLANTRAHLDRVAKRFWQVTQTILADAAEFHVESLCFVLHKPPVVTGSVSLLPAGRYHLISKSHVASEGADHFLYRLTHPLGEYVLESAKGLATPAAGVSFDVSGHPARIHVVEALRGRSGYLTLTRLVIDSYEREEYLLFSGVVDLGQSLDQETLEKLMSVACKVVDVGPIPGSAIERLEQEAGRHQKAVINRSLQQNSAHFNAAREKLEKWADDMVFSAEKALADTKAQLRSLQREARQASTLDDQRNIQEKIQKLERQQRSQRQEIFKVEDEIMVKRDSLIDALERRLSQRVETETLFQLQWMVH